MAGFHVPGVPFADTGGVCQSEARPQLLHALSELRTAEMLQMWGCGTQIRLSAQTTERSRALTCRSPKCGAQVRCQVRDEKMVLTKDST